MNYSSLPHIWRHHLTSSLPHVWRHTFYLLIGTREVIIIMLMCCCWHACMNYSTNVQRGTILSSVKLSSLSDIICRTLNNQIMLLNRLSLHSRGITIPGSWHWLVYSNMTHWTTLSTEPFPLVPPCGVRDTRGCGTSTTLVIYVHVPPSLTAETY